MTPLSSPPLKGLRMAGSPINQSQALIASSFLQSGLSPSPLPINSPAKQSQPSNSYLPIKAADKKKAFFHQSPWELASSCRLMVTLHKCCKSRSLLLCSYDYRKEEKSKEKGGQGKVGQFLEFKFNRIVLSFFKTPMCDLKTECRVAEQNR